MKKSVWVVGMALAAACLTGCGGTKAKNKPAPVTHTTGAFLDVRSNPDSIAMVFVEGGTFTAYGGSTTVTVGSFYIGKTEITQKHWYEIMGDNPSEFKGNDNLPVESIGWDDVQEFIRKLNAKTGKDYRLPAEAEWEYAARGGNKSRGYAYSGGDNIDDVAWYSGNSDSATHSVGTKQANELGLHDMSGNVWEWTDGVYRGYGRLIRGGSWHIAAQNCRVPVRGYNSPEDRGSDLGFRLALGLAPKALNTNTAGERVLPHKTDTSKSKIVDIPVDMVFVKGGVFMKGCDDDRDDECDDDEKPARKVTVKDFYISKYEVTYGLWKSVGSYYQYGFKEDNLPFETIHRNYVLTFIKDLNAMTGKKYRLPTEAEWEYAARGGNMSRGYKYSGGNNIDSVAWHGGNSGGKTNPVGTKAPNELGIYDMSGNVWEWTGTETHTGRGYVFVIRGGGWYGPAGICRVSYREYAAPERYEGNLGFRLVRDP